MNRSPTATVERLDAGQPVGRVDLGVGGSLRFGSCAHPGCDVDLHTRGADGHLALHERHVTITNHSRRTPLKVWHVERPAEVFTVLAGQADVAVPFDMAEIGGTLGPVLRISGLEASTITCIAPCADAAGDETSGLLNPRTDYYRVLTSLA